jgi:hypothetical protein
MAQTHPVVRLVYRVDRRLSLWRALHTSVTWSSELEMLNVPSQYLSRRYDGDRLSVITAANSAEGTPSQQTMRISSTPVVK